MEGAAVDGLAVHESTARGDRHRASAARIDIVIVIGAVVDDGGVANLRVVEIHVAVVPPARVVPRIKRLARAERKPTDPAAKAAAESEPDAPM